MMTTRWWYNPERWAAWVWRIATSPLLGWIPVAVVMLCVTIYGLLEHEVLASAVSGLILVAAVLNICTVIAAGLAGRTRHLRPCWLSLVGVLLFLALLTTAGVWEERRAGDLATLVTYALFALGFPTCLMSYFLSGLAQLPWHLGEASFPLVLVGLAYLQSFVLLPLLLRWRTKYSPVDTADKVSRLQDVNEQE